MLLVLVVLVINQSINQVKLTFRAILSAKAEITNPSVDRDRLMLLPSRARVLSPVQCAPSYPTLLLNQLPENACISNLLLR